MKLLPSLKQKKRYLVFEIISEQQFLPQEIMEETDQALLLFLGQLGLAKSLPLFIKAKGPKFILKINHRYTDECKSALLLIKKIKNKPAIIKSIITAGTIKKASTYL